MALTTVRVLIAGTWHTLTYNGQTGYYEAQITAPATSHHQTGDYYNVTVSATNQTGTTVQADSDDIPALKLVVNETTPPTLTLVSPAQGYVTTTTPQIIVDAQDTGAGIDASSVLVTLDGVTVASSLVTKTAITNGYRITYAPTLSQGAHTVSVTVKDYDENTAQIALQYTIDTVPPSLDGVLDGIQPVLDDAELTISGLVSDEHASPVSVEIVRNGADTGSVYVDADGRFSHTFPLDIGRNSITVTATDQAGLSTVEDVFVIRLVTDRKQSDVDRLKSLRASGNFDTWSDEDKSWYLATVNRATYNASDMNRVTDAVNLLDTLFSQMGNQTGVTALEIEDGRTTWQGADVPELFWNGQTAQYLDNVDKIRDVFPIDAPNVPADMENFMWNEANDIEAILVSAGAVIPLWKASHFVSGEIFCGET